MTSPEAHALKDSLARFLDRLSGTAEQRPSVDEMRGLATELWGALTAEPDGVTWTEVDAGGVQALWADPRDGATDRVVQYVHGGGYVIGSVHDYRPFTGHIAKAVGCRVLSVDYRLAPEHPHPAPVEDSTAVFRWLRGQGYDAAHLAIAGDSAGGGLTLATLLELRDSDTEQPAAAVPLSPWADMEAAGDTMTTNAEHDALVQAPMLVAMAGMFLNGHDPKDPLVAPVHADFTGLAPLYIQVGGHETLLDDARRVAAAADRDGVDVTLEVFPEMQHVFQIGAGTVPESDDAVAKIGAFLRPRLGL